MISNYFKVALRALQRQKLTSFINIAGLGLGMACCLLIAGFISDEMVYDQYHEKAERIYRVTRSFHSAEGEVNLHLSHVAPPVGPLLKNDFGEIETIARTLNFQTVVSLEEDGDVKYANTETNLFLAEPALLDIMDISIVEGTSALQRPFTLMLSEKTAKRYFNSTSVTGKRLRINSQFDLEVTGVYKDFPSASHWHPDFLVSFVTLEDELVYGREGLETNWGNNAFGTYLVLAEGADPRKLEAAFPGFLDKHFGNYAKSRWGVPADWKASQVTTLFLQPLTDIHLRSHLDDEIEANGDINTVYMMAVIGVFIMLIACFNFVNLSTARATKRSKDVGMRKVAGAAKSQLIFQYLSESSMIAILSMFLALAISAGAINWLNELTGKSLSLMQFANMNTILLLLGFTLIIGIVAGVYPAFVMSSMKPILTLKGTTASGQGGISLRRTLVVAQFAISTVLMIATVIIFQQLSYLGSRSLGYDKDQVINLPFYGELYESYDAFYNEVTRTSDIRNIGRSSRIPTGRLLDSYGSARVLKGDTLGESQVDLKTLAVDEMFFDTYGIPVVAGRNFSKSIVTDDSLAFVINESAARQFGWSDYTTHINEDFEYAGVRGKLIGVVRDFHFESLHQPIAPMIFLKQRRFSTLSFKVAGNEMQSALATLEQKWKEFLPGKPFDYTFLSERYNALYDAEQRQAKLFTVFALLAIFIASLGLLGLATFNAVQRVKEIGVRKVLGASVPQILSLLSRETIILIVISNLIAWPVAWYMMSSWLDTFAYHVSIGLPAFLLSAFLAITVAIITVSVQSLKAATSNPAETLKHE